MRYICIIREIYFFKILQKNLFDPKDCCWIVTCEDLEASVSL